MKTKFYNILKTTSACASIGKFRLMAAMQTRSYMATYFSWLSAKVAIPRKRGRSSIAMPRTLDLLSELALLQRGWWLSEHTILTSPFRRPADSFGLTPSPRPFLAS